VNQQGYPGDRPLLHIASLADCDGDTFVVSSLLRVPHAVDRVLFAFLSIASSQDDARTLSCYVPKLTKSHAVLDVHLTDGFDRAVLAVCPKFS
jgi:hypothetical protein